MRMTSLLFLDDGAGAFILPDGGIWRTTINPCRDASTRTEEVTQYGGDAGLPTRARARLADGSSSANESNVGLQVGT